jgi:hypothetical protein
MATIALYPEAAKKEARMGGLMWEWAMDHGGAGTLWKGGPWSVVQEETTCPS